MDNKIEHELELKNLVVVKRDGSEEKFQAEKIENAIEKAFESAKEKLDPYVAKNVLWDIKLTEFKDNKIDIEWIQDNIEEKLSTQHYAVMKKFMLYRYLHKLQREKVMDQGTTYIDCNETIDEYVGKTDWRIKANSNAGYSHAGMVNNTAGKVIANYWLDKILTKKQGQLHRDGYIHIHDLDFLTPYCGGWSLRALLDEGFNGLRSGVDARPPKHIMEALNQMANFLSCLSLEWAGAQAFSSFDTYLAPYLFRDGLDDEELYRHIRSFVYNLNVPSKWGQPPFSNLTLDLTVPDDLKEQIPTREQKHIFSDITPEHKDYDKLMDKCKARGRNKLIDMTYKDFLPEMERITIAYYRVLTEGEAKGRPFTFPIPTVNITEDFDWNSKVADALFENAARRGNTYFQNFIGSQYIKDENGKLIPNEKAYKPGHIRSMCPLTADTEIRILDKNEKEYDIPIVEMPDGSKVKTRSGWKKANLVKMPNTKVLHIKVEDNCSVDMGINHLQPVIIDGKEDILRADELKLGMQIPSIRGNLKITSIEEKTYKGDLYCVVVLEGEDRIFELSNGLYTHNCRLQLDLRELLKRGGGLFGSAEMTGGISNTTINLARLGYLHKGNQEEFYKHLDEILEECKDISERRRKAVIEWYERGLYPYTARYLPNFKHHFSIIGINGGNEMIRNFTGDEEDITTEWGVKFAYEVTEHIRNKIKSFQEETGNLYNMEASPAESATARFAKEDKKRYPGIIQAGFGDNVYYTNSTQVPVNYSDDMFEVLDLQDDLQCQYTGGTVLHLYVDNPLPDKDVARDLVRKVVTNYKLPYVTITPTIRVCEKHGEVLNSKDGYCPYCDRELLEKYADELSEADREALNLNKKGLKE